MSSVSTLMLERGGAPAVVTIGGYEREIRTDRDVTDLIGELVRDIESCKSRLWMARVRLGIALIQLEKHCSKTMMRLPKHVGLNARMARRAKALAQAVAPDGKTIDEDELRRVIAEYESRERGGRGPSGSGTHRNTGLDVAGRVAGRIEPEDVDLDRVSLRKVELATGVRKESRSGGAQGAADDRFDECDGAGPEPVVLTDGRTVVVGCSDHSENLNARRAGLDTSRGGHSSSPAGLPNAGRVVSSDGDAHVAGRIGTDDRRPVTIGEQLTFADLLQMADEVTLSVEAILEMEREELAEHLRGLDRDELSMFIETARRFGPNDSDNHGGRGGRSV